MFGWLKSIFLDDKARKALAKPKTAAAPPASPQRAELIRQAQQVHKAKRKILDALSDEDRAKLVAMAISSFLAEAPKDDAPKPPKPKPKPNTKKAK
ncbi:MAG: hypothetical protein ACM31L_11010 [Actinomycetota bacterium]